MGCIPITEKHPGCPLFGDDGLFSFPDCRQASLAPYHLLANSKENSCLCIIPERSDQQWRVRYFFSPY